MTRAFAVLPTGGAPTGTGRREIEVAEIIQHPQARQYLAAGFLFALGGAALLAAARQFVRPAITTSMRQVQDLVDSNEAIPMGLDPESVRAARRIARHLRSVD